MLENTEGTIKNGQSRESGNIGHTRRRQYVLDTAVRKHIDNANKAWTLLQTTVGKYKPNIVFMRKSQQTSQHETQNVKTQWNQSYCVFHWHKGVNVFQELSYFSLTKYRFSLVNKISIQLKSYIINDVDITSLISPRSWYQDLDLMSDLTLKRLCDDMCHILRQHLGFSKDIVVKFMVFAWDFS